MSIEHLHHLKKIREIKTRYGFLPEDKLELEKSIIQEIGQDEKTIKIFFLEITLQRIN